MKQVKQQFNPFVFTPEKIEELKTLFKRNATAPAARKKDCIQVLNAGMVSIYGNSVLPLGTAIHETMQRLKSFEYVRGKCVIEFRDINYQITKGKKRPENLDGRAMGIMMEIVDYTIGWNIFGLSVMDGYHAVTLLYNSTNQSQIEHEVYWCDQWNHATLKCLGGTTKFAGCKKLNGVELDAAITELTQRWWDLEPDPKKKPKTRATLWRLIPPESKNIP